MEEEKKEVSETPKVGAKKTSAPKAKKAVSAKAVPSVKDLIKDVWYAGLGALSLSEEKAREILNNLVEKGKLTQKDAKKFLNDLEKRIKKNRKEWEKWVDQKIKQASSTFEEFRKEARSRLKKIEDFIEKIRSGQKK